MFYGLGTLEIFSFIYEDLQKRFVSYDSMFYLDRYLFVLVKIFAYI